MQSINAHPRSKHHLIGNLIPAILICLFSWITVVVAAEPDNYLVPTADSARLSTDVYLPADSGEYPVILIRTPYTGAWLSSVGERFVDAGYAVVIQFARGVGGSEGQFFPFVYERGDGLATLEWITEQQWCDGRVGLWGVS